MEKIIRRIYWVFTALFLCMVVFILTNFQYDMVNDRVDDKVVILDEIEDEEIADETAPLGRKYVLTMTVPEITNGREDLSFYTLHQHVKVYIGDELVYSMTYDKRNSFGTTPGRYWNFIPLLAQDSGKELRVELTSPYENAVHVEPVFYMGEKSLIVNAEISRNLIPLTLALFCLVLGISLIGFVIYTYRDKRVDKSPIYLGIFAVMLFLWQFFDLSVTSLLVPANLLTSYMPLMALMMIPVPFVMFLRRLHQSEKHPLWDVMCILSLLNIAINFILQLAGFADFRESLYYTHVTYVVIIFMGFYLFIQEWRHFGLNKKLKLSVGYILLCAAGAFIDMIIYYMSNGISAMIFGLIAFLLYIIIFGIGSVMEVRHLMDVGKQAVKYEEMAYRDQLTGLYNRLAWVEALKRVQVNEREYGVVMLDLNDLKKCNDSHGHDSGDRYIQESAEIINDSFNGIGGCFRMGGDEFAVLVHSNNDEDYVNRIDVMLAKIRAFNQEHEDLRMQIAYGVAIYDKQQDYDLNDTRSRADAAMYHRKFKMKSGERR